MPLPLLGNRLYEPPSGGSFFVWCVGCQRTATVAPSFGNLRHNKRLSRFTVRGKDKVGTQWRLFCVVHDIEKVTNRGVWA